MSTALAIKNPAQFIDSLIAEHPEVAKWHALKSMLCPANTSDAEAGIFYEACIRTKLDPIKREIHLMDLGNKKQVQTGIDGYRIIARRTGEYLRSETMWCDKDGIWVDVWLKDTLPHAARCRVWTKASLEPEVSIAYYKESVRTKSDGTPNHMWKSRPVSQLAKCAEAHALRKACPAETAGVYVDAELGPETVEASHTVVTPPSEATAAQLALVEKVIKSRVFSDEEREAAMEFMTSPGRKQERIKAFIDRILSQVEERKAAAKADELEDAMQPLTVVSPAPAEEELPF